MKAQVNRVGVAFEFIETELAKVAGFKKRAGQGLKKEWEKFMVDHHKKVLGDLRDTLDGRLKVFEGKTGLSILRRWDYAGVFRRAKGVAKVDCGFEQDDKKMDARVKNLIKVYNKVKPDKKYADLDLD